MTVLLSIIGIIILMVFCIALAILILPFAGIVNLIEWIKERWTRWQI